MQTQKSSQKQRFTMIFGDRLTGDRPQNSTEATFKNKTGSIFFMVNGGDNKKLSKEVCDSLFGVLLQELQANEAKIHEFDFTDTKICEDRVIGIIADTLLKAIRQTTEDIKIRYQTPLPQISVDMVINVTEILYFGHYGTSQMHLRRATERKFQSIVDTITYGKIATGSLKLKKDDRLIICSNHFAQITDALEALFSAPRNKIPSVFTALKHAKTERDASAYIIEFDAPWHAASSKGLLHSADAVSRARLFRKLDYGETMEVLSISEIHQYEPGDIIIKQGDPGESIYVLLSGTVRLEIDDDLNRGTFSDSGRLFGEFTYLDPSPRTATLRSATASELLEIENKKLDLLIRSNPALGVKILYAMGSALASRAKELSEETSKLRKDRKIQAS